MCIYRLHTVQQNLGEVLSGGGCWQQNSERSWADLFRTRKNEHDAVTSWSHWCGRNCACANGCQYAFACRRARPCRHGTVFVSRGYCLAVAGRMGFDGNFLRLPMLRCGYFSAARSGCYLSSAISCCSHRSGACIPSSCPLLVRC